MRWTGLTLAALAGCSVAPPPAPPPPAPAVETAQESYQRAERLFMEGDFEATLSNCERALQLDPHHEPARTLRQEVQFILGADRVTRFAAAQTRLAKLEGWLEMGRQHLFFGDLAQAELCALLALDLAPLLLPEMDVELRLAQAQALLDWVRVCREED